MPTPDQNIYIGRAGEFLASYILESYGLRTTHVDLPHDDLWCDTPSGMLVRVQVKSCSKATQHGKQRRPLRYCYQFGPNRNTYDGVYLLVALDKKLCLAFKRDDTIGRTLKINPDRFTQEAQTETIRKAFML
tara:strand:- start:2652 stop:3047 length:396 start_codon:yes stop_codon:yes gene_type:complete